MGENILAENWGEGITWFIAPDPPFRSEKKAEELPESEAKVMLSWANKIEENLRWMSITHRIHVW